MTECQRQFVFISNPQCASSSIHKFFGTKPKMDSKPDDCGLMDNHSTAVAVLKRYGPTEFESRYRFGFVRNPWDRCYSWWKHHHHKEPNLPQYQPPFRDWIMRDMPHHWTRAIDGVTPYDLPGCTPLEQWRFFIDETDKQIVDFIARFELLERDMRLVAEKLSRPFEGFTRENESTIDPKEYESQFDRATVDHVSKLLAKDIERFGYADCAPVWEIQGRRH